MSPEAVRNSVAFGCVVGGIWIHYSGGINFGIGLMLWFILAATAGYMRPFVWMIVIAPIPWLVGVVGGVLAGRYDDLGDAWFVALGLSTVAGIIGVIFGASARRSRKQDQSE